jgi:6-pyruvoyl tetrahydropterin synthase/QueD family protein
MDLYIRHNVEMAHRLLNLPGKCQQIHGHSLKVKVSWIGGVNADGYFTLDDGSVMDFSNAKRVVRKYLDESYDHHLLLSQHDPWAQTVYCWTKVKDATIVQPQDLTPITLPGMVIMPADPTTENICLWIAEWCSNRFSADVIVEIDETGTNGVAVAWSFEDKGDAQTVVEEEVPAGRDHGLGDM